MQGEIENFQADGLTSMGLDSVRFYNKTFGPKEYYFTTRIKVNRGSVVVYEEGYESTGKQGLSEASQANLRGPKYKGYMSPTTARKAKKMLEAWIHSINCAASSRLRENVTGNICTAFLTLTLPADQIHDDREIKRSIFMPFVQSIKRDFEVQEYFAKFEPQENGRWHCHMVIDRYIDKEEVSAWWNRACEHLGYVSRYHEQSGSMFPPATNIMKLASDSKAISYVVKYLCKAPIRLRSIMPTDEGKKSTVHFYQPKVEKDGSTRLAEYRPIQGAVWSCSDEMRQARGITLAETNRTAAFVEHLKQSGKVRIIEMERAVVYAGDILTQLRNFDKWLWTLWRWHHLALFQWIYGDRVRPPSGNYYDLDQALTEVYR
jgi:hypothetical protein